MESKSTQSTKQPKRMSGEPHRNRRRIRIVKAQIKALRSMVFLEALKAGRMPESTRRLDKAIQSNDQAAVIRKSGTGMIHRYARGDALPRNAKAIARIEAFCPGAIARSRHVLFDLLDESRSWTLPRVWEYMRRLPTAATQVLFVPDDAPQRFFTERRQPNDNQVRKLFCGLNSMDRVALAVALLRENQAKGDGRGWLKAELQLSYMRSQFDKWFNDSFAFALNIAICDGIGSVEFEDCVYWDNPDLYRMSIASSRGRIYEDPDQLVMRNQWRLGPSRRRQASC